MLDDLPQEIILLIIAHLPTVSAITNLAATNRKIHEVITSNKEAICQTFVLKQFPSIHCKAPWRTAAFDLTTRTRAWDRRAFIARECWPPNSRIEERVRVHRGQNFGFMPVIDSYEGPDGKEVLAIGAAGRLQVRSTLGKFVNWSCRKALDDTNAINDILDLHLLRPHQNRNRFGESVVIRKANREIALFNAMPEKDNWVTQSSYLAKYDSAIDCVAVSGDADTMLAVCDSRSIQLFPVHSKQEENKAGKIIPLAAASTIKQRKRSAKFVGHHRLAVAAQYLEGPHTAPIEVFDIGPAGLESTPLVASQELEIARGSSGVVGRTGANVLAKVNDAVDGASNLLLSGWSDGGSRLYDLRSGNSPVREYRDPVDDGQIFSLLPVGQEKFFAGSHQNACLKTFDMRMNGQVYDRRQLSLGSFSTSAVSHIHPMSHTAPKSNHTKRGINIFLSLLLRRGAQPWQPLPQQDNSRLSRYRGSIYSLSSPSSSSRTVYAGIENHVIQLDFVNTDDIRCNRGQIRNSLDERAVLNLSCYERPRPGHESTDTILLRKQMPFSDQPHRATPPESEWDERWSLEQQQRTRKNIALHRREDSRR